MSLHHVIQRLLLIGARIESLPSPAAPQAPPALLPLIEAIAGPHRRFDELALHYGNRYRSGFWAIYLLSAIAVLFAVMPLALGWDSASHLFHPYAGLWAIGSHGRDTRRTPGLAPAGPAAQSAAGLSSARPNES